MSLCTGVIVDQYSDALALRKVLKSVADELIEKAGALEKDQVYQVIRPLSDPHVIFCIQRIAVLQTFQIADTTGRAASPTIEDFFSCDESDLTSSVARTPAFCSDIQLQNISLKRKTIRASHKKNRAATTPRERKKDRKDIYPHISNNGVEGSIKQLLVDYDNGEFHGSLWGSVWTLLKECGWSNESMPGKYLEATAFIPSWSQERFAEDKRCGNNVKTLVKNRDYFVYAEDALHYLRKHGLVEVSETSPSPGGRAARRSCTIVAPVVVEPQITSSVRIKRSATMPHVKTEMEKKSGKTPKRSMKAPSSEESDGETVYAASYAHLSDEGAEGDIKHLLMEFDLGLHSSIWAPVWELLKTLDWSNETMPGKYLESAAFIPSWSQDRFAEDKKCGNSVKTLRKNRDYFVHAEDALRYLRKHGLKEVLEQSPSPNGRAARRSRSVMSIMNAQGTKPDACEAKTTVTKNEQEQNPPQQNLSVAKRGRSTKKSGCASALLSPYPRLSNVGVEGSIKQLLVDYDNGEFHGSLWGSVWTLLKECGWSNESMPGKYLEATAFIPSWSQERFAEDKRCGNNVKTLVKSRDYFVYAEDALHYLRKHGLVEVSETSPSPGGRAARRSRSVSSAVETSRSPSPSCNTTVQASRAELKGKRSLKRSRTQLDVSSDETNVDKDAQTVLASYTHLSDEGAEGNIKHLLMEFDLGLHSSIWAPVWELLKTLDWSNETMPGKYLESAAFIPSWSQDRFAEDKKCGNSVKTLRKNRDYFVHAEDALRYLRKHGLKEVLEQSPSPNGRAARRSRSVMPIMNAQGTVVQNAMKTGGKKASSGADGKKSKRMKTEEWADSEDESVQQALDRRSSASKPPHSSKSAPQGCHTSSDEEEQRQVSGRSTLPKTGEKEKGKGKSKEQNRRKSSKIVEVTEVEEVIEEEPLMTQMELTQGPPPELIKSFSAPAKDLLRAVWLGRPRLNLSNFSDVYKILKNHNWSYFYGHFDTVYYAPHAKGISRKKLSDYKEGVDYFVGSDAVIEFIKKQMRARGHDYAEMIDVALFFSMSDTVLDKNFLDGEDENDEGVDDELYFRVPTGRVATSDRHATDFFDHVNENLVHSDNESVIDDDQCDDAEVSNFMCDLFDNGITPIKEAPISVDCNAYNDAMGICADTPDFSSPASNAPQAMEIVDSSPSPPSTVCSQEKTSAAKQCLVGVTKKTPTSTAKRINIVPGASLRVSPSTSPTMAYQHQRTTPSPVQHRNSTSSGYTTGASTLSTPLSARNNDSLVSNSTSTSSSPVRSPSDTINLVRNNLQPGNEPSVVLGRESECAQLESIVLSAVRDYRGTALSVCGMPGLGKTLSIKMLQRKILLRNEAIRIAFVSATSCCNIFVEICKQLGIWKSSSCEKTAFDEFLGSVLHSESRWFAVSKPKTPSALLIIDEFDRLPATLANKIFEVAMMPQSRLILVALSNTLKLAQQFPYTVPFQPYTEEQLLSVATSLTHGVFHENAIKMIVKSETGRGDMRSLLNFCNLVMNKALEDYSSPEALGSASFPIVQLKHVTRIRADTGAKQCTVQESIAALPALSRSLLTALVLGFKMAQSFSVTEMHNTFNTYYQTELNIGRLTADEVESQASNLLNCGLLAAENRGVGTNRHSPREAKLYFLKVDAEELVECHSLELIHRKNIERMLRELKNN